MLNFNKAVTNIYELFYCYGNSQELLTLRSYKLKLLAFTSSELPLHQHSNLNFTATQYDIKLYNKLLEIKVALS